MSIHMDMPTTKHVYMTDKTVAQLKALNETCGYSYSESIRAGVDDLHAKKLKPETKKKTK